MYLDKPMKDHNLLQAICRTNRTFGQEKTHGLIVDYIGIFDDVARALDFDEKAVQQVVSNIDELRKALPVQMQNCLAFFPGVDRTVGGYEGLLAAQQCLPEQRDARQIRRRLLGARHASGRRSRPTRCSAPYETDYSWLTQVYESVKPPSGNGKLLWHALGAKTVELINENVHVESCATTSRRWSGCRGAGGDPQRPRAREEGQGGRDQARRAAAQARRQPEVHRTRRAAGEAQGAPRAGLPHQPGVPEGDAGARARTSSRPRSRGRPGGGAGPRQGSADGAVQRGEEREHPHHRRAHRRRITASMLYDLVVCPHRVTMDLRRGSRGPRPDSSLRRAALGAGQRVRGDGDRPDRARRSSIFPRTRADEKERRTAEAMDAGAPLIHAGRVLGRRSGWACRDLLRREPCGYVPGDIKSGAGEEGPEDDSKLEAHYAVQLALYVDILERAGKVVRTARVRMGSPRRGGAVRSLWRRGGKRNPRTLWED